MDLHDINAFTVTTEKGREVCVTNLVYFLTIRSSPTRFGLTSPAAVFENQPALRVRPTFEKPVQQHREGTAAQRAPCIPRALSRGD